MLDGWYGGEAGRVAGWARDVQEMGFKPRRAVFRHVHHLCRAPFVRASVGTADRIHIDFAPLGDPTSRQDKTSPEALCERAPAVAQRIVFDAHRMRTYFLQLTLTSLGAQFQGVPVWFTS